MNVFVARQPIFDRFKKLFGYELLFRDGSKNYYEHVDGDEASNTVIANSFLTMGMQTVTGGKRAFINFTTNLLKNKVATSLPKDMIAVEILEDVEPDEEVIFACKNLKELGYLLVLDDFVYHPRFQPLIELADIIKIDFLSTSYEERISILQQIGSTRIKFLAEKIETLEQYEEAFHLGFSYFQGYYFSQPVILSAKEIPNSKLNYLRLLYEINQPTVNFEELEMILREDVSLSYKLLKFLNSAHFSFRSKVNSIRQALILLGTDEVRKWASLITLKGLGEDKPDQLILSSIIRAKFGEVIAQKIGLKDQASNAFFMGMFSMIDVFLDRPLTEIFLELPIPDQVKKALEGEDNQLRDIFELIVSYEKGHWNQFSLYAQKLRIDESIVPQYYFDALDSAEGIVSPAGG
ncbi:MAG: HDOD domain-containing protein [Desulfosporosinus sp.]|nr:HDOD domain-containing protein [Desulfosporosinus sp.]